MIAELRNWGAARRPTERVSLLRSRLVTIELMCQVQAFLSLWILVKCFKYFGNVTSDGKSALSSEKVKHAQNAACSLY